MKKFALVPALALGLSGCFNLTPQEVNNLQLFIQAGKTVVQATQNLYCAFEPGTATLIGVWDKSKDTTTFLDKLNQSTIVLCQKALNP